MREHTERTRKTYQETVAGDRDRAESGQGRRRPAKR
jgi:hypothetical protein